MEHPLAQFLYCPECGSSHFEVNNEKSKKCADCGFVYYFNPSLLYNKQPVATISYFPHFSTHGALVSNAELNA